MSPSGKLPPEALTAASLTVASPQTAITLHAGTVKCAVFLYLAPCFGLSRLPLLKDAHATRTVSHLNHDTPA